MLSISAMSQMFFKTTGFETNLGRTALPSEHEDIKDANIIFISVRSSLANIVSSRVAARMELLSAVFFSILIKAVCEAAPFECISWIDVCTSNSAWETSCDSESIPVLSPCKP